MEKDRFFIEYFFMGGIVLYSLYLFIFSNSLKGLEEEITEKMKALPIAILIRYLMFLAFNSYFVNMLFDISWLLWICLFSVIGLWIILTDHKITISYFILNFVLLFFFFTAGVPTHQDSFKDYISDHTEYECLTLECVKVKEVIEDETLKTEIKPHSIVGYSFDWYLLFARGNISLQDEEGNIEVLEGTNIGGLWLLNK
jgi:hypothetical protein